MAPQIVTLTSPNGRSTARILTGYGFNCFEYQAEIDGQPYDVLWSLPGFESGELRPSSSGIPVLFPFPGRIQRGELTWEGRQFQLPQNDRTGNAIHGFVFNRAWRVLEATSQRVVGEFQASIDDPSLLELWPADFKLTAEYELLDDRLVSNFTVANPDSKPLPWGFGTHPYFRLPGETAEQRDQCRLIVPVAEKWELEELNPTGRRLPIEAALVGELHQGATLQDRQFDSVFTGIQPTENSESALTTADGRRLVTVEFSAPVRELVVFTPPHREAVCIEPYTCAPDPIRLQQQGVDGGLNVLSAGEQMVIRLIYRIG